MTLRLSSLGKTWLVDLDGVLLLHNGHRLGGERLLPGARAFFEAIGADDAVVLLTARPEAERDSTLAYLVSVGLRWDHAVFGLPPGERICVNDRKPSGLATSHAVNLDRDRGLLGLEMVIDDDL